MTSTIKVNNIQNQCGANIINENSNTITLGASGDTITIPAGATITNNGTQTGFGRTGTVNWQTTIKTGDFTAVSGEGYFINTTSGAVTMTLPASPSAGDIVSFKDYKYTFDTNNLTIARNGSNIGGGSDTDVIVNTEGIFQTLIYADSTQGWLISDNSTDTVSAANVLIAATGGTVTTCGDYKIHTFTGSGTFQVTAGAGPVAVAEYIVVAGGGSAMSGGGGGGGFRFASPSLSPVTYPGKPLAAPAALQMAIGSYPITVGAGGSAASQGSTSTFSSISSAGGGRGSGAAGNSSAPDEAAGPGGSGGGRGSDANAAGGSGNQPPVSPPQGKDGGAAPAGGYGAGGGGGGAMCAGSTGGGPGNPSPGGPGGDGAGVPTAFGSNGVPCGSYRYYAGGGGGGPNTNAGASQAAGGKGGGGVSGTSNNTNGTAGTANTGGGAGGNEYGNGNSPNSQSGGSGIVIIRYQFQ